MFDFNTFISLALISFVANQTSGQARKRGDLCTRDIECGHHFLNCFKGPSGLGTCQTPWDFRQQCRNDNDCSNGFQCRTIQCRVRAQRDNLDYFDPNHIDPAIDELLSYCRLIGLGRSSTIPDPGSGGGLRWWPDPGSASSGGIAPFIQWFVDNCN